MTVRLSVQERKKKVRAYLDNLTNENKALQVRVGELETALNDALTAKNAIQHNRLVLEDLLHKTKEKVRACLVHCI